MEPAGEAGWKLSLPPGPEKTYRLAQLDDYVELRRGEFRWTAPARLEARARVSQKEHPGTWGFGYWNDPFAATLGLGGIGRRIPALPQTAWFFYASQPNYLSLRDDLPASGLLAATFQSSRTAQRLLPLGVLAAPGLLTKATRRALRRVARRFIHQDAVGVKVDPTEWHVYRLEWRSGRATFQVDGETVLDTRVAPIGRLGCVVWIDNQYALFTPEGGRKFGTLKSVQGTTLEMELSLEHINETPPGSMRAESTNH